MEYIVTAASLYGQQFVFIIIIIITKHINMAISREEVTIKCADTATRQLLLNPLRQQKSGISDTQRTPGNKVSCVSCNT
jgi:hypothetical protein